MAAVLSPPLPGRTVEQLARTLRRSEESVRDLLRTDSRRGVVEYDEHGNWRLTAKAEARYGDSLRRLDQ